jgi:hypothetical protein
MILRASKLVEDGPRPRYAILTEEMLEEMFSTRLLAASLLARADPETAFMAGMVYRTLISVKEELEELIS